MQLICLQVIDSEAPPPQPSSSSDVVVVDEEECGQVSEASSGGTGTEPPVVGVRHPMHQCIDIQR